MYNKTIIEFGFRMISWIIKTSCLYYLPQPSASADNRDLGFDNSWYHAQPHPIIELFNITQISCQRSQKRHLVNSSNSIFLFINHSNCLCIVGEWHEYWHQRALWCLQFILHKIFFWSFPLLLASLRCKNTCIDHDRLCASPGSLKNKRMEKFPF